MTKEQAINYLQASGMSEEQIETVVQALRGEGHWTEVIKKDEDPFSRRRWYCSSCGGWQTYGEPPYCPSCGAKMEVEHE